jgi:lipoprotein-anchoring transpeptidase ErfK/SrfK
VEWAKGQLKQVQVKAEPSRGVERESIFESPVIQSVPQKVVPPVKAKSNKRVLIYAGVFSLLACAVLGVAAWSAVNSPVFASIVNAPAPTQENLWAEVEVAKPEVTPLDVSAFAEPQVAVTATPSSADEPTALPVDEPTRAPTDSPAPTSTPAPTEELPTTTTPEITETPGTMAMAIVQDTPTSQYIPRPTSSAPKPSVASSGNGARWIDVDLTNQRVYAYEGDTVVNSFIVSTGTWQTPTVTGQFNVYVKYRSAKMSGPGYYLPNVPYIMYFYGSYGLHGTYWHNNFGTPMSHGCVNLTIDDAGWLYNWASVGTLVNVHY